MVHVDFFMIFILAAIQVAALPLPGVIRTEQGKAAIEPPQIESHPMHSRETCP